MTTKKKRSRARWLLRAVLVLMAGGVLLAVAGPVWIVPAVVRWQLRRSLPDYWVGRATIETIDFSWFGPTYLRGVSLVDDRGRLWARVGKVRLTLRGLGGVNPVLTDVVVDGVDLRAHFVDGVCRVPLKPWPKKASRLREYVDIQSVVVQNISVGIVSETGLERVWRGFHGRLERQGETYRARLLHTPAGAAASPRGPGPGGVGGNLLAVFGPDGTLRYSGEVVVDRVDLPALAGILPGLKGLRAGTLSARCRLVGNKVGLAGLRTVGVARVDDIDMARSGPTDALLAAMGVDVGKLAGRTGVEAVFHSAGTVVTIDAGRLANRLSAIVAEPGGTIDLRTKHLDLYLVVAPVSALRDLLGAVPIPLLGQVLGAAGTAADKLSRVHLLGKWTDPPERLVRKEPVKDIEAGTLAIFKGILDGGGQFGRGLADSVGALLKALGGEKKPPPP